MIQLSDVTKSFRSASGQRFVAKNINAVFPDLARIGLLGINGAGKSTLLRMIGGKQHPDHGSIRSDGTVSWPVAHSGGLHRELTGAQNVRFVARIYRRDPDKMVEFCQSVSGIGHQIRQPIREYSAGMRARLAFALSMAIPFDFYLFDEITAVGDMKFREACVEMLHERLEGSGAFIASHSMAQIRALCTSAAVLEKGRLRYFENVEEGIALYEKISMDLD